MRDTAQGIGPSFEDSISYLSYLPDQLRNRLLEHTLIDQPRQWRRSSTRTMWIHQCSEGLQAARYLRYPQLVTATIDLRCTLRPPIAYSDQ